LRREGGVKIKEASPLLDALEKAKLKIFKRGLPPSKTTSLSP